MHHPLISKPQSQTNRFTGLGFFPGHLVGSILIIPLRQRHRFPMVPHGALLLADIVLVALVEPKIGYGTRSISELRLAPKRGSLSHNLMFEMMYTKKSALFWQKTNVNCVVFQPENWIDISLIERQGKAILHRDLAKDFEQYNK